MPPTTFDDFAADLEQRLEDARDACASGDQDEMKDAHASLAKFIAGSDDTVHGVIELDDVAADAMRDVTLARLDQSLVTELSKRSADVARLVKTFSTQSADNLSAASKLRLERAKAVVTTAIGFVDELKQLAAAVDDATADGAKLAKALQDAIAAVAAVQKRLAG